VRSSLRDLFSKTKVHCSKDRYVVVSLRKGADLNPILKRLKPFSSITYEKDEISLVLSQSLWSKCLSSRRGAKVAGPYRLITFDIVIDLDVYGYLAKIFKLLADSKVSIVPASTYLRDYILVREADCRRTLSTIKHFLMSQSDT
jgi:hypothetical protein